jgi:hypothetical protein
MTLPQAPEAQPFYRVAKQRFEDAEILLEQERTTGAVYLAGYSVECMLKALILDGTKPKSRKGAVDSFKGAKAHDYEWLKQQYRAVGGPVFPRQIREPFVLVTTWSTDFRYHPGALPRHEAEDFLKAVSAIIKWAEGRF